MQVSTDSRNVEPHSLFIALKGDRFDGNQYALSALEKGAKYAIVSDPTLACEEGCYYVADTLKALQGLARHHRQQFQIPVIAITGTNGKTTTKELLAAIMQEVGPCLYTQGNLNNHIGVPLTLLRLRAEHTSAIIEMGASKPGDIKELVEIAEPTLGLITNIGKAHLEGFGSQEGILATKSELFDYLTAHHHPFVLNLDDPLLSAKWDTGNCTSYGTKLHNRPHYMRGQVISNGPLLALQVESSGQSLEVQTHLVGNYNTHNVLAALSLATSIGVDLQLAIKGVERYQPANHRSQLISGTEARRIIADAYNANPSSMMVALQNLLTTSATHKVAILGDMKELGTASRSEHLALIHWLEQHPQITPLLCGEELCQVAESGMKSFANTEALLHYLQNDIAPLEADTLILLKGSHSTALEKVLPTLQQLINAQ